MVNLKWLQSLRDEIARARKNDLEPLEGGWVRVYRHSYDGRTENVTEQHIASLRETIARIQGVAGQYYEEHVHRA
ncbi:MAG: hypothetical protein JWL84_1516 [Rhodospirillales bacterium]|nr:hypothetical protein [Rhodospirillales bacterium]